MNNNENNIKMNRIVSTYTTSSLESQLHTLKERSQQLSQSLTQKLATSQSGQNLLHIGPSLSTLPPDLHSLITNLQPLKKDIELFQDKCFEEYKLLNDCSNNIEYMLRRCKNSNECANMYTDLVSAEHDIKLFNNNDNDTNTISCLERAALTTLHLVQELRKSTVDINNTSNSNNNGSNKDNNNMMDVEKAEFLIHLAPRVRRLESDSVRALSIALEQLLQEQQHLQQSQQQVQDDNDNTHITHVDDINNQNNNKELLLKKIGCCLRGLALLGRGKEAESAFATTAIMPIIRTKVSMGRLDEGGPRGHCCGLFSLLDDILYSICNTFGCIIRLSESMFNLSSNEKLTYQRPEIDLLVCGVWIPIVTALLTDPSIKMAIFSPGIASILQANYTAIDVFLSELAHRLLTTNADANTNTVQMQVEAAQIRIYEHPSTTDFYHKWNLPIYYQLRFGEACSTLNKILLFTQEYGWNCNDVYTESSEFINNNMNTQRVKVIQLPIEIKNKVKLPLFLQLYQILINLWSSDVILRPLTHRFLRGSIQIIHRTISFIKDGLNGIILFQNNNSTSQDPNTLSTSQYNWSQRIDDLASVAYELHLLHLFLTKYYLPIINNAIITKEDQQDNEKEELKLLVKELFLEASEPAIPSLIHNDIYNTHIVNILITNCTAPLSAVKGVAATYRMTNRPPPTQPSPFISTILRPLQIFLQTHSNHMIITVSSSTSWKQTIIDNVTSKYHVAIQELIETVKRTEVALKNRKSKKTMLGNNALMGGGNSSMTDGEKVRLQLLLDYRAYRKSIQDLGIDVSQDMIEMESSLSVGTAATASIGSN